uniref:Uncharacterized protein n=1 Tax=Oryza meridionalis TaxID=40149 RepID=A0A0E0CLT1_9ORYZ
MRVQEGSKSSGATLAIQSVRLRLTSAWLTKASSYMLHRFTTTRRRRVALQRRLEHLDRVAEVARVHEAQRLVVHGHRVRGVRLDAPLVLPHRRRVVLGHHALQRAVAGEEAGVGRVAAGHGLHVAERGGGGGEVADLEVGVAEAGEDRRVARVQRRDGREEREGDVELAVGEVVGGEEERDKGLAAAPLRVGGVGAGADGGEEGVEAVEGEGAVGREEEREQRVEEAEEEGRRRAARVRAERGDERRGVRVAAELGEREGGERGEEEAVPRVRRVVEGTERSGRPSAAAAGGGGGEAGVELDAAAAASAMAGSGSRRLESEDQKKKKKKKTEAGRRSGLGLYTCTLCTQPKEK